MRPGLRGIAALILAVAAAFIVAASLVGHRLPSVDFLASFLPLAGGAAVLAFVLALGRSRAALALSILCIGVCGWKVWHEIAQRESHPEDNGERLVVITHNLAAENEDLGETMRMLAASDADILLLQEARGQVGAHLPMLDRAFPYHSQCGTGCDLAIYSRLPIERPRWRLRGPDGDEYGPPLMWTIATLPSGRRFVAISLHQPWPFPPGEQEQRRWELIAAMTRVEGSNTIVAGDFNLTPWGAGMAELDEGLSPLRRITRGQFSFPARVSGAGWPVPLLPIDQIFVGPAWTVASVERMERTGSDHYPIRAELRLH